MTLYILLIGFIGIDGEFDADAYLLEKCPPIEAVIPKVSEKVLKGNVIYWTAKCNEFDFVPFEMPEDVDRT